MLVNQTTAQKSIDTQATTHNEQYKSKEKEIKRRKMLNYGTDEL